jgi:two-component system chemotaxis sensor kinase CheA
MDNAQERLKIDFLSEAKDLLLDVEQCFLDLERNPSDTDKINPIFRFAHNLKSSSSAVGFLDLANFAHTLESFLLALKERKISVSNPIVDLLLRAHDYLVKTFETLQGDLTADCADPSLTQEFSEALNAPLSTKPLSDQTGTDQELFQEIAALTRGSLQQDVLPQQSLPQFSPGQEPKLKSENIRVSLSRIEKLLNNVGELSILQAVITQQSFQRGTLVPPLMREAISAMSKILKETQDISMGLRMLPIRQTFQKMQRIVRDSSKLVGKEVELHLSGEDTEIDKAVLEAIADPLAHLIRNAIDHGFEDTHIRLNSGKPSPGQIYLSAFHRAGQVVIEVKDDGKGLDAEKLVTHAKSKKIIPSDANLSKEQAYELVFLPGLSTKETVTALSGRGFGLDVVKTSITALQGQIEIESALEKGTCFRILLPLTLATMDSIIARCGDERYVIPLSQVVEFFCPSESDITRVYERSELLTVRNETIALFKLSSLIGQTESGSKAPKTQTALIIHDGRCSKLAVMVDKVMAQQQVVVKPLGSEFRGRVGLIGFAILGDGKPALILDLIELTKPSKNAIPNKNGFNPIITMEAV